MLLVLEEDLEEALPDEDGEGDDYDRDEDTHTHNDSEDGENLDYRCYRIV